LALRGSAFKFAAFQNGESKAMWYCIALLSGLLMATADAFSKKESARTSAIGIAWVREAYAIPLLLPLFFFIEIPALDTTFWLALCACVLLDMLTTFLYMRALQIAPLSLTIPYLGLTPLFLLIIPSVVLGESLSAIGIVGVVLVALGTYLLQIGRIREGWLQPWLAVFKNKGSLYMLIVALCYAVTATLGKLAIQHSSPLLFTAIYFLLLAAGLTPFALRSGQWKMRTLIAHPGSYLRIGLTMGLMAVCHFTAINRIPVAYMISIKRLSLIFAILYGWLWFRESDIRHRLTGGLIILAGATCIAFA